MTRIVEHTGQLDQQIMRLLLLADPNEAAVLAYMKKASVLTCVEGSSVIAVAAFTLDPPGSELKNIAVDPQLQNQGLAKQLIATARQMAQENGAAYMDVGTGNSSLSQLALYQKCGFRMHAIVHDFFESYPEPIYENGIRCIDQVILRATL